MRRVFDLDVLACPWWGGRMSVIATIEAGEVMRKILVRSSPLPSPSAAHLRPPSAVATTYHHSGNAGHPALTGVRFRLTSESGPSLAAGATFFECL